MYAASTYAATSLEGPRLKMSVWRRLMVLGLAHIGRDYMTNKRRWTDGLNAGGRTSRSYTNRAVCGVVQIRIDLKDSISSLATDFHQRSRNPCLNYFRLFSLAHCSLYAQLASKITSLQSTAFTLYIVSVVVKMHFAFVVCILKSISSNKREANKNPML